MLYNGGHPGNLFRAAFMESGFPYPIGPIEQGQPYYDFIVQQVGCSTAADTLECLRTAQYDELMAAFNALPSLTSYQVCNLTQFTPAIIDPFQSIVVVFAPRTDGVFLIDNPQQLVERQQVARIPFVTGLH